jgi:Tfp pilus assembly protein PilX
VKNLIVKFWCSNADCLEADEKRWWATAVQDAGALSATSMDAKRLGVRQSSGAFRSSKKTAENGIDHEPAPIT